jgi:hypothetical protein
MDVEKYMHHPKNGHSEAGEIGAWRWEPRDIDLKIEMLRMLCRCRGEDQNETRITSDCHRIKENTSCQWYSTNEGRVLTSF